MDHVNRVYQEINKIHENGDFLLGIPDESYFLNSDPAFQECDLTPSNYEHNNVPIFDLAKSCDVSGLSNSSAGASVRPPSLDTARGLIKAAEGMTGSRPQTHGDRFASFNAIAKAMTFYLKNRKDPSGDVRPHDVAAIFMRVKEIRADYGEPIEDHFIDLIGYAAIEGELCLGRGEAPDV